MAVHNPSGAGLTSPMSPFQLHRAVLPRPRRRNRLHHSSTGRNLTKRLANGEHRMTLRQHISPALPGLASQVHKLRHRYSSPR